MATLNEAQVTQLWTANGGSSNPTVIQQMLAIVCAESGFRTDAMGGGAYGLSQIQGDPKATDPNYAMQRMVQMSGNGTNWAAWCTAWGQPGGNCGHGNPGGIQPGSAAARCKPGSAGAGATAPASASSSGSGNCLASFPLVGGCMITKSNLKALKAGLLIAAGGATLGIGVVLVMSWGMHGTAAGKAAVRSYNRLPGLPTTSPSSSARKTSSPGAGFSSLDARLGRSRQSAEDEEQYQDYLSRGGARGGPERAPGETRRERYDQPATIDARSEELF